MDCTFQWANLQKTGLNFTALLAFQMFPIDMIASSIPRQQLHRLSKMAALTRHALRVYASLGALKGGGHDVLDALIPFFEPILQVMHNTIFDPHLLAVGVQKLYHWRFTQEVAEQFIPRLVRVGALHRTGTATNAAYRVHFPTQKQGQEDDIKGVLETLVDEFEKFPPLVTDILNYIKTRDELADILIRFLVSSNAFIETNEAIRATANEQVLLADLEEGGRPLSDDDQYMAARFVRHVADTKPDFIPYLVRLGAIGLLTEVVDDFVRPTTAADKVDLTIILDAPLALDYLGLSGRTIQEAVRSVFNELRKIGCKLMVFPITCEEMTRNLNAMLSLPPNKRHGYTHEAMLKGEVIADYVQAVALNPEEALARVDIHVRSMSINQFPNLHVHFSHELYQDFFGSIHWAADVTPRDHDAVCLALLVRLREGKHSSDIFRCRYVFATRNPTFARVSRDYCVRQRLISEQQEGPVVHQRELATIAWLRTGLGSSEIIPRTNLVASCDRVLRVRPEVTAAIRNKLREYVPEKVDQFELLLLDHRSIRKMADATLNDETVVTGENAQHLFELMRQATVEEEKTQFEAKLTEEKKKNLEARRKQRQQHENAIAASEKEASMLAERIKSLESINTEHQSRNETIVRNLEKRINSRVTACEYVVTALLLGFGLLGMVNTFSDLGASPRFWKWFAVVVTVLGIYQLVLDLLQCRSGGYKML
jgi:hypothetical protein